MSITPANDLPAEELGPAMEVLDERQRAFVRAMIRLGKQGISNAAAAAKQAGYGIKGGRKYWWLQGHRLTHNERVQAALLEETRKRVNMGAALIATPVVIEIAMDKTQKGADRLRAAEMLFNRGGMPALTEHRVTVEHKQPKAMLELAARLAKELDMPVERLVGINREAMKVIEGQVIEEAVEVKGDG